VAHSKQLIIPGRDDSNMVIDYDADLDIVKIAEFYNGVECKFGLTMGRDAFEKIRDFLVQIPESNKPCPFCHSGYIEPIELIGGKYCVMCNACGAKGPGRLSHRDAMHAWNCR